ncbi:nickel-binding protein [Rhodobacter ferrooxidans]|uniref:DUF4242 domain-containing protein n=1 Tax=Rhodobacter ferrooxidans TaxID=371731 RepID=C8S4I1_9RHOB|nr:nickel-binding protein [Rhodobacter sp. SW2]EEW24148.1 conserved hypothetical protein [Rhodobacter sp. SW2]
MKTFLVERDVGNTPTVELLGMSAASWRTARQMQQEGDRIYYLGSTYLPADGLCLCLYTAKSAEVVANHSQVARLPVRRITDAVAFGTPAFPEAVD